MQIAVVTNKLEHLAVRLLDALGLRPRLATIIGGDTLGPGRAKPAPDLLHEMLLLEPGLIVSGFDVSAWGISCATDLVKPHLQLHPAQAPYPYPDQSVDLVLSLGTLHNLRLPDLQRALSEIERVGRQAYVMLESYRNDQELFNLQCWALTCESFFDADTWVWLYRHFGYSKDYEFIYF